MESCEKIIFGRFADELGPAKVLHLQEARSGLRAIVVVDNVARGPAIGGIRIAPDVTTEEVFRLARAMTLKNAAAGLPHGGGKAGLLADHHRIDKEALMRAFALRIRDLTEYIPGPDMGTDEECMGYLFDEIGRCVGRPRALGGIPLDEIGATGYGLSQAAKLALPFAGLQFAEASMAVQGFGSVGRHAAFFLSRKGVKLVAACDTSGTIFLESGLDVARLSRIKQETGRVIDYPGGEKLSAKAIVELPCDIFIPAARPDVITMENQGQVKARVILEGANIPITEEAERVLHDRGVLCIPDFIANAGGVICGAVELHGGSERESFLVIKEKIKRNTDEVLQLVAQEKLYPREAAIRLATDRVRAAMAFRR